MAESTITKQCVIIGGSAGSLTGVQYILEQLDSKFPAPVIIVQHRSSSYDSTLTELLSHKSALSVKEAEDKEPIQPGAVYLAPGDYHLLIETNNTFSLDHSEKVMFSRPSIDVTLQTAADAYGSGLIAILLSGANTDGTNGLHYVRRMGGVSIAQDPAEAMVDIMPASAIKAGAATYTLTVEDIVKFLHKIQSC